MAKLPHADAVMITMRKNIENEGQKYKGNSINGDKKYSCMSVAMYHDGARH